MSAKSVTEETPAENVVDDLPKEEVKVEVKLDQDKLAALKAKSQSKQQENKMSSRIVAKKERSLNFAVIGTGQGGSRIAEQFYALGYPTIVCNTAAQDLKFINVPDSNKLLFENGIAGAAKDRSIGFSAASQYKNSIKEMINEKLSDTNVFILISSLGGGSGSGSLPVLIETLSEFGKPVIVMAALPMSMEDVQTKSNALDSLSELAGLVRDRKIANLIVVDNAKIESIYRNVDQLSFYGVANKAIVDVLDTFNTLSMYPSATKALDSMELSRILLDSEGLTIYGEMSVSNYEEDTAIAAAVIDNLAGNLLAGSFDLKTAKYVGFLIVGSKEVLSKIPHSSIAYASAMVNDISQSAKGVFRGTYVIETNDPNVKVYTIFSGLGLPTSRIDDLKNDVKELQSKVKDKEEKRNLTLQLDTGKNETTTAAQKIKDQISAKNSTFGKFVGNNIVDRRK